MTLELPDAEWRSDALGVCLSGSGWICVLDEGEAGSLARRLQLDGFWSLAYKVTRCREVALEKREKKGLLATLGGMQAAGLELSTRLRRLLDHLDDDLFACDANRFLV
jgi:hypothetical protein